MKNSKKICLRLIFAMLIALFVCLIQRNSVEAKGIPQDCYEQIKGWWTQNSSGGYNVKFSKTKILRKEEKTMLTNTHRQACGVV